MVPPQKRENNDHTTINPTQLTLTAALEQYIKQEKNDTQPEISKDITNTSQEDIESHEETLSTDTKDTPWDSLHNEQQVTVEKSPNKKQRFFSDIDWERREIGDHYPLGVIYHCNVCLTETFDTLKELQEHIVADHDNWTWNDYLEKSGLHRCAGCNEPLDTLVDLYCDKCNPRPRNDRISCRNCGEKRVLIEDPFCEPACAAERAAHTSGELDPLNPPKDASLEWISHPHRIETGIPSTTPFIGNHKLTCRECYTYGSDKLHSFAVHVSEKHPNLGWGGYIEKYALQRCRVCGDPLSSLLPIYCSSECQQKDPDPPRICALPSCTNAVERRQKYCSKTCYRTDQQKRTD